MSSRTGFRVKSNPNWMTRWQKRKRSESWTEENWGETETSQRILKHPRCVTWPLASPPTQCHHQWSSILHDLHCRFFQYLYEVVSLHIFLYNISDSCISIISFSIPSSLLKLELLLHMATNRNLDRQFETFNHDLHSPILQLRVLRIHLSIPDTYIYKTLHMRCGECPNLCGWFTGAQLSRQSRVRQQYFIWIMTLFL